MAYVNQNGQVRIGVRSGLVNTPVVQPAFSASLLQSIYGIWNGDTTTNELGTSLFGAWNGEYSGSSLDASIFAVYNADGNANDSKGTNHGTLVNGATFSTGKIGQSFQFNGTNNYLKLPNNSLNFTDDFSVSFWMKLGSLNQTSHIIDSAGFSGIGTTGWVLNLASGNLQFSIYNNNTLSQIAANYILTSTSVWYHIVITSKSGYNAIYINNSLIISNTSTMRPNYVASSYSIPYIGVFKTANTQFFSGNIDGLNFWNKSLTVDEVTQLYNSGNGAQYPYSSQLLTSSNDNFGTNHGTLMNGCTFTTGKIGSAFTFDGVNDYVNFTTNSWNSTVGTDFSISLWVKFTSTATQTIISNMSSPSINVWSGWEIRLLNGRPIIHMWNNAGVAVGPQGSVISTNTWYHIVATRKKGSRTRIYMNGSLEQTDTTNTNDPSINGTYYPNIGHLQYASSGHWYYMANGSLIDSVNLWNREISADEVTQLYNSGKGAQYPFTGTFSSAINQLGVDNGTLMNGCYLSDGKVGQAFTFDGVNDYVQLPNNSLNLTTFSISAWVNPSNTVGSRTILNSANYVSALDYGWKFRIIDGQLSLQIYSTGGLINEYKGGSISTNTWTHVSATRINGSTKLYINGSLVGSQTSGSINNNPNFTTTTYCSIGSLTSAVSPISFFIGSIDSLSVWQKELTQAEVTELYNSGNGKQITATPIVQNGLILNLDASRKSSYTGTGTTWTDISGSGNSGTFIGNPTYNNSDSTFTFSNSNYIKSTTGGVTGNTTRTVSIWFKINGLASNDSNWSVTDQIPFSLGSTTGGNLSFAINISYYAGGNTIMKVYGYFTQYDEEITISGDNLGNNQWRNITVTWNGLNPGTLGVYIDGVFKTSLLRSSGEVYNTSAGYIVGTWADYNRYYTNKLGSVLVYNRVLTSNEILQNYNATKSRFGL